MKSTLERYFLEMTNYVPFLKIKVNEIGALLALNADLKKTLTPFFDFPRKDDMTEESFQEMVGKAARSVAKNLKGYESIYLDNFDIEDRIQVGGSDNYNFIISEFNKINFIPVVGLDRTNSHNQAVFDAKKSGNLISDRIAIRLQSEDFESFALIQHDLKELIDAGSALFKTWIVILDNRVCLPIEVLARSDKISKFIPALLAKHSFEKIVITGSSIPASIGEIVPTESYVIVSRSEVDIFRRVKTIIKDNIVILGDYTIVSPLYSDIDIPPEAMRNVTAPKITYSDESVHYVLRGGALTAHPRGDLQYNDLAGRLIGYPYYRKPPYSFGDNFLDEKAKFVGTGVTPSSILRPTINAHMTYMCKDFKI